MNLKQQDLVLSSQFAQDLSKPLDVDGKKVSIGFYNIVVNIAQLRMNIETGLIPNRHWKLKTIKTYYCISGSKEVMLKKLRFIKKEMLCL